MLIACPFPLRVPFGVLLTALRAGRDNGQPVFPAQPIADAADLRIVFAVRNVLLMLADIKAGRIKRVIVKDYCAIIGLNQKDLENQGILA